ncbi:hypothetical protein ACWD4G_21315 [Streptomyces sp. NPDC002643]
MKAWLPRRMARARATAGPLLRLLGLAVVLFAVALTHGATPESAGGHLVTSTVAPPPTTSTEGPSDHVDAHSVAPPSPVVAPAERYFGPCGNHGDGTSGHPDDHCAVAQPHPGPSLAQPRFAVSVSEGLAAYCVPSMRETGETRLPDGSSAALRALVVQQI